MFHTVLNAPLVKTNQLKFYVNAQLTFTCPKSATETLKKSVKYAQS